MKRILAATIFATLLTPVWAQMTPVGVWHSFDESTGELASEIRIVDNGGVLFGRIEKLLRKAANQKAVCEKCSDDRKDKPIIGMEVIRGARQAEGTEVWEDGKILDPKNGKVYKLKLTPIEAGKKLQVRGFLGFSFLGRTQVWTRVN